MSIITSQPLSAKHLYNETFHSDYANLLRSTVEARSEPEGMYPLAQIMDMPGLGSPAITLSTTVPGERVDLVTKGPDEDDSFEVIYNVQGFVSQVQLGPVTEKPRYPERAQQSIHLVDLGTGMITTCTDSLSKIHAHFQAQLSPSTVEIGNIVSHFQEHPAIVFSNRYFSTNSDAGGLPSIPFTKDVDPLGVMGNLNIPQYHTEDNVVDCYEKMGNLSSTSYMKISCGSIYPCDLVELQVAFCAVPIGKRKHRVLAKLRSVCVLDRTAENNALKSHLQDLRSVPIASLVRTKRRHGYTTEEDNVVHATQRMRLEGPSTSPNA